MDLLTRVANFIDSLLTGIIVSQADRTRMGLVHRFEFEPSAKWTGYNVELLLRQYGIRIGGREKAWVTAEGSVRSAFCVGRAQAEFAEYILLAYKVPVTSPLLHAPNAQYAHTAPRRGAWGRKPNLLGWIMDVVAKMLGINPNGQVMQMIRRELND